MNLHLYCTLAEKNTRYSYMEYWKNTYHKLTMVLWELYIIFFVRLNVYFSDFSNLSIRDIINFIMWKN